jgi:hypothetical protein
MPRIALPRWLGGSPSLPASALQIRPRDHHFAIYYGWPSGVNGARGDVEAAAATFGRYPVVVFGDGLEHPTHPDHERTVAIMRQLSQGRVTRVFGYVDLGVSTQNLSIPTLLEYAQAWQRAGASGIFLDDAGKDFGVDGARRDAAVDGIHRLGLKVILNTHTPEDAFDGRAQLEPGDGYLFESFQVTDGRIQPAETSLAKADKALRLALYSGVDVYALATGRADDPGFASKYAYAWWSTLLYGFSYFQYTTIDYSARSGQLEWFPQELPNLGTRYEKDDVCHVWAEGIHSRSTDSGEIRLSTGSTTAGEFVPRGR